MRAYFVVMAATPVTSATPGRTNVAKVYLRISISQFAADPAAKKPRAKSGHNAHDDHEHRLSL
jgi:hypothetical protein